MKPKKNEKTIKLAGLGKVRCPDCGGPINRVWFSSFDYLSGRATFIAECWSGNLEKKNEAFHIFCIKVPMLGIVEVAEAGCGEGNKKSDLGKVKT